MEGLYEAKNMRKIDFRVSRPPRKWNGAPVKREKPIQGKGVSGARLEQGNLPYGSGT